MKGITITYIPLVYSSEDMEDFPALNYNDWSYEGVTSFINNYEKISTGKETSPNPPISSSGTTIYPDNEDKAISYQNVLMGNAHNNTIEQHHQNNGNKEEDFHILNSNEDGLSPLDMKYMNDTEEQDNDYNHQLNHNGFIHFDPNCTEENWRPTLVQTRLRLNYYYVTVSEV